MKKGLLIAGAFLPILMVAGCGTANNTSTTTNSTTSPTNTSTANTNTTNTNQTTKAPATKNITLQVITDQTNGQPKQVPAFVPANITLPENANVTVTVINHDDGGAPLVSPNDSKVQGTLNGTITVDGKTVTSVPANDIAHTITIAPTGSFKGLNIPIEAHPSTEKTNTIVFTFHTPSSPTTLHWACMSKCGSGSDGMGGVMNWSMDPGYMSGTWTVQ